MNRRARPALAGLFASGLLVAMAAAAGGAEAAGGPGTLDPSFGTGGKVLTSLAGVTLAPNPDVVSDAALASNGDIVVSGSFGLARYLPDGKLDTSFGTDGFAPVGFGAEALAIQPNGEYVVAGQAQTGPDVSQDDFAVARLTTAGQPDPAFGHGGVVTTAFPGAPDGAEADTVLVEPDGDILAGGDALVPGTTRNAPVLSNAAMALYDPSGKLVPSFGSGGLVQPATLPSEIITLGLDAAGDIFVLPAHAEFSPAGQLDPTVTAEPITASSHGGDGALPGVFLPNGQSLITDVVGRGRGATDVQVHLFNANGSTDPAFSNPPFAYATPGDHESPGAIAVAPDGKIVVVGTHFRSTSAFGVARLNASGSLDSSFGTGGVLTTSFQGGDGAFAVVIQPNGDIVAIGDSINGTGAEFIALARYLG